MARKSSRANPPTPRSGSGPRDIAAGLAVATAGGVVFVAGTGVGLEFAASTDAGLAEAAGAGSRGGAAAWLCALLGYAGFVSGAVALVSTDLRTHTLPNRTVAAVALWTAGALTLASVSLGDWRAVAESWGAAIAAGLVALLGWRASRGALGGGDVKLLPAAVFVAVWAADTGARALAVALFLLLLATAVGLTGIVARARSRRELPAGPAILSAALGTVALAPVLAA